MIPQKSWPVLTDVSSDYLMLNKRFDSWNAEKALALGMGVSLILGVLFGLIFESAAIPLTVFLVNLLALAAMLGIRPRKNSQPE